MPVRIIRNKQEHKTKQSGSFVFNKIEAEEHKEEKKPKTTSKKKGE